MSAFDRFLLRLRRSQSPPARFVKKLMRTFGEPRIPRWPRLFRPLLSALYNAHFLALQAVRFPLTMFYRGALFQAKCASFGRDVRMQGPMPFVMGQPKIHVGDNVFIGGGVTIISGRMFDEPRLVLENHSMVGWNCTIIVNKEIVIEEHVILPPNCRISDTDGHPREADRRAADEPPDLKDIRPVRICRHAWIGNGSQIMKGVTIGEGAIIGANSVVISDIPPYALAMGNPAEIIMKNFGVPTYMKKQKQAPAGAAQAD